MIFFCHGGQHVSVLPIHVNTILFSTRSSLHSNILLLRTIFVVVLHYFLIWVVECMCWFMSNKWDKKKKEEYRLTHCSKWRMGSLTTMSVLCKRQHHVWSGLYGENWEKKRVFVWSGTKKQKLLLLCVGCFVCFGLGWRLVPFEGKEALLWVEGRTKHSSMKWAQDWKILKREVLFGLFDALTNYW